MAEPLSAEHEQEIREAVTNGLTIGHPDIDALLVALDRARKERDAAVTRAERLEGTLERIHAWSKAYPIDVFPEPDMAEAEVVLKAAGLSLGAISASAMRHVVRGIKDLAEIAPSLAPPEGRDG